MDRHQGLIFQLYIVQNKTLTDVMSTLQRDHECHVSRHVLLNKLRQWGYMKNIKRSEALQILQEKERRELLGKDASFTLHERPVKLDQVERHAKRNGLMIFRPDFRTIMAQNPAAEVSMPEDSSINIAIWTPPSPVSRSPSADAPWRNSEKLLFDIDVLIKGSFEAGHWGFNGDDLIISSSPHQMAELQLLHGFLGYLESGCTAADAQNLTLAGDNWKQAFKLLEVLVRGQYHDIIPNLVWKINDLNRQGHEGLADILKTHIANCSRNFSAPGSIHREIFGGLGQTDLGQMVELEERIMANFAKLFTLYLGLPCYSAFVMKMNAAERRLLNDPWTRFDDCVPPLAYYDAVFGLSDRRSLHILGLRADISHQRAMHHEAEAVAAEVVLRAQMVQNDDWQRLYHLIRGWFYLGRSQCMLQKRELAIQSLSTMLLLEEEFNTLDESYNMFSPEIFTARQYLEELQRPIAV